MDVQTAKQQLQKSYQYGLIAGIIGFLLMLHTQITTCFVSSVFWGYCFWAGYWGWVIVRPFVDNYFDVPVSSPTLWDAITERRRKFVTKIVSKITLSLFVGCLGGALYKHISLWLWLRKAEREIPQAQNQRFRINS
ncbi:MAG: hypothetical protein ACKVTZ_05820 [Bacteroidia bacterium]